MATIAEVKTKIESANALGIANLTEKGVEIGANATTYEIMKNIAEVAGGGGQYKSVTYNGDNTVALVDKKGVYHVIECEYTNNKLTGVTYDGSPIELTYDGTTLVKVGKTDVNMANAPYAPSGEAELNIAYGDTPPDDTSKLWIKANEPDKLTINNGSAESATRVASYIEATGTQYIDTGYTPNENTKLIITLSDIVNPDAYYNNVLLSASTQWAYNIFCLTYQNAAPPSYNDGAFRWMSADTHFKYGENIPKATIELYRDYVKYNDEVLYELNNNYAYNSLATLRLFGGMRFSDTYAVAKGFRLYSLQIIENDTLIKDYIPIYHKGRAEAGLFDRVNGEYLFNQGTGSFNYEIHTYELTKGNIELQASLSNNIFKFINTDNAQVEIGVENVFIGNDNNEAEVVEAYLHNGTEWVQI